MSLQQPEEASEVSNHSPPPPRFNGALQQYTLEHFLTPSPSKPITRASASNLRAQPSPTAGKSKRKSSQVTSNSSTTSKKKAKRSTTSGYAPPSKYAHLTNNLTDSLAPSLICVFIGVNPGLRTATSGHAYAHPSNLFWRLAHSSGCTPRLCRPEEDGDLPHLFALGHTNIVTRPTKDASELSKEELDEGVAVLEAKIARWKPEAVAIVGKGIWESIWRVKHRAKIGKAEFKYGWQDKRESMGVITEGEDKWDGAKVFVATTTSGLAVSMRLHEKEEVWKGLGEWVAKRREERGSDQGANVEEFVEETI